MFSKKSFGFLQKYFKGKEFFHEKIGKVKIHSTPNIPKIFMHCNIAASKILINDEQYSSKHDTVPCLNKCVQGFLFIYEVISNPFYCDRLDFNNIQWMFTIWNLIGIASFPMLNYRCDLINFIDSNTENFEKFMSEN